MWTALDPPEEWLPTCFLFFPLRLNVSIFGYAGSSLLHAGCCRERSYALRCMGFSLWCLLLLWSTASIVVAHGLCCCQACGIFLEQGLNLCPLNWQWILYLSTTRSFPHSSAMQETWGQFLGWEDLLEKEMATHSSILAWRTPWTEEPGRLYSP